jgi:hypothetical protein
LGNAPLHKKIAAPKMSSDPATTILRGVRDAKEMQTEGQPHLNRKADYFLQFAQSKAPYQRIKINTSEWIKQLYLRVCGCPNRTILTLVALPS